MDNVRGIAINADFQAEGEDAAFGYSELYLNFESNKVGFQNCVRDIIRHCQNIKSWKGGYLRVQKLVPWDFKPLSMMLPQILP